VDVPGQPANVGARYELVGWFLGETKMKQAGCHAAVAYEVRFKSLFQDGRALVFPCDRQGHVDIDALGPRAQHSYLFARAMVGREYATPEVVSRECQGAH
jgi:hypothetical protein